MVSRRDVANANETKKVFGAHQGMLARAVHPNQNSAIGTKGPAMRANSSRASGEVSGCFSSRGWKYLIW